MTAAPAEAEVVQPAPPPLVTWAPGALLGLSADYVRLPDFLPTDTAPREQQVRMGPPSFESKVPIRVDVSDALRMVERFAAWCESGLRSVYGGADTYWTVPHRLAVRLSLRWSAQVIEHPPATGHLDVADEVQIAAALDEVRRTVRGIIGETPRIPVSSCPRCGARAFFTSPVAPVARCVSCGLVMGAERQ